MEEPEVLECPTDGCGNPIKLSDLEGLDVYICPNCAQELEVGGDDDDDDDDGEEVDSDYIEPDEDEDEDEDDEDEAPVKNVEFEDIVEAEPKKAPKAKKKKKKKKSRHIKHSGNAVEYLDFFLDHPEGVTIEMICIAFGLELQAAHYAQRRTFKDAARLEYECEKTPIKGSTAKMFFIREV